MAYFDDPSVRIKEELEDLREDIGKKEKEIREVRNQIADLEKTKELAESELEELFTEEKRLDRDIMRMKLEAE